MNQARTRAGTHSGNESGVSHSARTPSLMTLMRADASSGLHSNLARASDSSKSRPTARRAAFRTNPGPPSLPQDRGGRNQPDVDGSFAQGPRESTGSAVWWTPIPEQASRHDPYGRSTRVDATGGHHPRAFTAGRHHRSDRRWNDIEPRWVVIGGAGANGSRTIGPSVWNVVEKLGVHKPRALRIVDARGAIPFDPPWRTRITNGRY